MSKPKLSIDADIEYYEQHRIALQLEIESAVDPTAPMAISIDQYLTVLDKYIIVLHDRVALYKDGLKMLEKFRQ
jgi:hypothetical protein